MLRIRTLQQRNAARLNELGTCWRPLTTLARLYESVGEISREVGAATNSNGVGTAAQVGLFYALSLRLATQYCVDLASEYRSAGLELSVHGTDVVKPGNHPPSKLLGGVVEAMGVLSGVINDYESGTNTVAELRRGTAGQALLRVHLTLNELAVSLEIDLFEQARIAIDSPYRDEDMRLMSHWDPALSECLHTFSAIVGTTQCLFADRAKLWGAPPYDLKINLEKNIFRAVESLARFSGVCTRECLDGYVIEIKECEHIASLDTFTQSFRRTLQTLCANDPSGDNCMQQRIDSPAWRFRFAGESFFVSAFAPFYAPNHPRSSMNETSAFIFFQPESSFDANNIHSRNPFRKRIKETIRKSFSDANRSYSVELVKQPIEAYKYIKPLRIGDSYVTWWR
jgi:hypothetical protein